MDRKKILNKFKTFFAEVEAEVVADIPADEEFKDMTTIDGVILRTSEGGLVDGEKVSIVAVNEEGAEDVADAPEGEYTVEGKVVSVNAEGVIVSVVDAEVEEEVETEAVVEEEMEAVPKWAEALTSRIEAMETANSNLAESLSAIDRLSETVSKIANEPADEEIKLSKSSKAKKEKFKTREEKLKFLSKRK
tara:strand:- start:951 stop:1523 length:573 start_codon:yes stop_codon:yes gene_type:complete